MGRTGRAVSPFGVYVPCRSAARVVLLCCTCCSACCCIATRPSPASSPVINRRGLRRHVVYSNEAYERTYGLTRSAGVAQHVALRCSMLHHCVAAFCTRLHCVSHHVVPLRLQHVALRRSILHCVATCCTASQHVAACCSMLNALQQVAMHCSALQCIAVHCSALQCIAACFTVARRATGL